MGGWGLGIPNLVRILKTVQNIGRSLTYSGLISPCFALHPYEKQGLIKPELVIVLVSLQ